MSCVPGAEVTAVRRWRDEVGTGPPLGGLQAGSGLMAGVTQGQSSGEEGGGHAISNTC